MPLHGYFGKLSLEKRFVCFYWNRKIWASLSVGYDRKDSTVSMFGDSRSMRNNDRLNQLK